MNSNDSVNSDATVVMNSNYATVNHYPPCPDLPLGFGQHKDAVALTILAQDDVGGLEVKRKTDAEWILVKPTPNAYIINIGGIIQIDNQEATIPVLACRKSVVSYPPCPGRLFLQYL
nr:protein SRG1-like [Coffea arabica]